MATCLATGLRATVENLSDAGCRTVYLDGSFVTSRTMPNDFDACWEEAASILRPLIPFS